MAAEAAPAAAGGEDWKAALQLPPKDSRIRTAVSIGERGREKRGRVCPRVLPPPLDGGTCLHTRFRDDSLSANPRRSCCCSPPRRQEAATADAVPPWGGTGREAGRGRGREGRGEEGERGDTDRWPQEEEPPLFGGACLRRFRKSQTGSSTRAHRARLAKQRAANEEERKRRDAAAAADDAHADDAATHAPTRPARARPPFSPNPKPKPKNHRT